MRECPQTAFIFKPLGWRAAHIMATWHHDPPYDFYDFRRFSLLYLILLSRLFRSLELEIYAVYTENEGLMGFFDFHNRQDTLEIGLAMRPDLTGKGNGLEFVRAGMAFGKERFSPTFFRLDVATFNQRAIKVYVKAGFQPTRTFARLTSSGPRSYQEMMCKAEGKRLHNTPFPPALR